MDKKFPVVVTVCFLIASAALIFIALFVYDSPEKAEKDVVQISTPIPTSIPTTEPEPQIEVQQELPVATTSENSIPTPTPAATPPPLNSSDDHIKQYASSTLTNGDSLLEIMTNEEIVRKIVRAVYGLSEGRVVKEYRPIQAPKGTFSVNQIQPQSDEEQAIYRIARGNYSRYAEYISILSLINTPSLIETYRFYLPTFETAYLELGVQEGNFHTSLLKAIDILLASPEVSQAILLTRPSVMYKYQDKTLETLPAAHKLMIRMGSENSEALKLELRKLKERLLVI